MGCPSLLHSPSAGGSSLSYLTVIVCEAPLVSLMVGLSGLLVIFGASVRGKENGGGKSLKGYWRVQGGGKKESVEVKARIQHNFVLDGEIAH